MARSNETDPALDAAIRAAGSGGAESGFPVSEMELLNYMSGEADPETTERVRDALLASADLRRSLRDICADLDALDSPRKEAEFAAFKPDPAPRRAVFLGEEDPWVATRRRAHEHGRPVAPSLLERLQMLFRQPALAAAFVFLVMAYPTVRFFLDRPSESPLLGVSPVIHLDGAGEVVRGEAEAQPVEVRIPPGSGQIQLSLWSETPFSAGVYSIELFGPDGSLSSAELVPWIDPLDPYHLDLALDSARLPEGTIEIMTTGPERTSGSVPTWRHRFLLVKD